MPGDLCNAKIVVTRPEFAAKSLIDTLTQLGAHAISMPLFAIEVLFDAQELSQLAKDLPGYDLVICISRNAADIIIPHIPALHLINWGAVGPGTAEYLQRNGAANVLYPLQAPFDSNSLLLELQFRIKNLKNRCIMILTGADGNESFADALRQQGAQVTVASLYKRTMPKMSAIQLQKVLNAAPAIDIMVVTCVTSLANLQALAESAGVKPFGIPLLVVSPRIATYAREQGFVSVYVANGMSDANIVTALLAWRNATS